MRKYADENELGGKDGSHDHDKKFLFLQRYRKEINCQCHNGINSHLAENEYGYINTEGTVFDYAKPILKANRRNRLHLILPGTNEYRKPANGEQCSKGKPHYKISLMGVCKGSCDKRRDSCTNNGSRSRKTKSHAGKCTAPVIVPYHI